MKITALIAEDEPLLAAGLQMDLQKLWPELEVVAVVGNGQSALDKALQHLPDVVFLDIQMPGMTGLECAEALVEEWPAETQPFPLIVFVTAYDEYAVSAFERAAFDYVLKPVQMARLEKTCARLKQNLGTRLAPAHGLEASALNGTDGNTDGSADGIAKVAASHTLLEAALQQMRTLLEVGAPTAPTSGGSKAPLQVIQASAGNTINMVPISEVLYFEASDKYVRVVTAEREHLIRMSLRDLLGQIDPAVFWQIHRSVIVRCDAVTQAKRDEAGKLTLSLRGSPDQLAVSRLYAERFKGM